MPQKYDFIALDVETANQDLSSICQIGYCLIEDGQIKDVKSFLVNPKCEFTNSHIHGIGAITVQNAPSFPDVIDEIAEDLEGEIIVHHIHFDRTALVEAAALHDLQLPNSCRLDSAQFASNIIPRYHQRGYGLKNLCKDYGIGQVSHHSAPDDATCLARVFIAMLEDSGFTLQEIVGNKKLRRKVDRVEIIDPSRIIPKTEVSGFVQKPNEQEKEVPVAPFTGKSILFTGDFAKPRAEMENLATKAGFILRKGITKSVNYLVTGIPREANLPHIQPSQKIQKAEQFNSEGADIKIIDESSFYQLVGIEDEVQKPSDHAIMIQENESEEKPTEQMERFYTKITGVTKKNEDGRRRQEIISEDLYEGMDLFLEREPDNPHDPNAIGVFTSAYGEQVGYIASDLASRLAPLMDNGQLIMAEITDLTGGEAENKTLGVNLLISIHTKEETQKIAEREAQYWKDRNAEKPSEPSPEKVKPVKTPEETWTNISTAAPEEPKIKPAPTEPKEKETLSQRWKNMPKKKRTLIIVLLILLTICALSTLCVISALLTDTSSAQQSLLPLFLTA